MSASRHFEVSLTRIVTFTTTIEASSQEEAIELAQELYDTDNSGFEDRSDDDGIWEAEAIPDGSELSPAPEPPLPKTPSEFIATFNDILRTSFMFGRVVMTEGIQALSRKDQSRVVEAVQTFKAFTPDNDPHGERDFGAIKLDGIGRVFWKIDYYDHTLTFGSENPADPGVTTRVLTIMMAEEY